MTLFCCAYSFDLCLISSCNFTSTEEHTVACNKKSTLKQPQSFPQHIVW